MIALLYFATAIALLLLADRFVARLSRAAAIALLLLPLVFTGRAVLTGRVYAPVELPYAVIPLSDYRGELRVPPAQSSMLTDIAFIIIPWREAVRRAVGEGAWPHLNRFALCGEPLAAAMQPAVYSPFTWIALLLPTAKSFTYTAAMAFFLAALGMFLFTRELGRSEMAALVAAAIFTFSAPMALQILWPLGFAWALAPLLFLAMRRAMLAPGARSVTLLTMAFGLLVVTGHPETLLHATAAAGIYGLIGAPASRRLAGRRPAALDAPALLSGIAAVVIAGALALLLTAVALLPFFEVAPHAGEHEVRTKMYAPAPLKVAPGFARSAALADLFPFLRLRFSSVILPRAEAGSIALALALVALVRGRWRERWFFAALLAFAFLAGTDSWPVAHMLHRLPLLNTTLNDRLVSLVPFCMAVLASFGVDEGGWRWAAAAVLVVFGAGAVGFGAPLDRLRLAAELVPLAALLLTRRADVLLGLLLVQRVAADGALVPTQRPEIAYPPLALFAPLRSVREPFRITAPGFTLVPDIATMYGLEDARGATAMTYAPLAETFPLWRGDDLARPMLSMMNVRYAVAGTWEPIPDGWREVTVDHQSRLLENTRALRRAFVPRRVREGANALQEMKTATDFGDVAWVDGIAEAPNGSGRVSAARDPSGLRIDAAMDAAGWVVISETAWPGWRAYIDGRRVALRRANHAFLAIYVPAGRHQVFLRYLPQSFVAGRTISVAFLLILLAIGFIRQVV